jgi:hypothetical protein
MFNELAREFYLARSVQSSRTIQSGKFSPHIFSLQELFILLSFLHIFNLQQGGGGEMTMAEQRKDIFIIIIIIIIYFAIIGVVVSIHD